MPQGIGVNHAAPPPKAGTIDTFAFSPASARSREHPGRYLGRRQLGGGSRVCVLHHGWFPAWLSGLFDGTLDQDVLRWTRKSL